MAKRDVIGIKSQHLNLRVEREWTIAGYVSSIRDLNGKVMIEKLSATPEESFEDFGLLVAQAATMQLNAFPPPTVVDPPQRLIEDVLPKLEKGMTDRHPLDGIEIGTTIPDLVPR